ncbi:MAG: hypothetical protein NWF05_01415 [Candidatus Bathyarchaeota archaeon]|nr:hypothetical protein [Candidatus Bathyarchaeota archaeon]
MLAVAKSKRAVTPILATLLIIVLAVAAVAVTYSWITTNVENTAQQAGVFLYEANVAFRSDNIITVAVGNSGVSDTRILAVYVGTSESSGETQSTSPALPIPLAAGQLTSFNLSYAWEAGVIYDFKIVSPVLQQVLSFKAQAPPEATASTSPSATPSSSPSPTPTATPTPTPTATPTPTPSPTPTASPTPSPTPTPSPVMVDVNFASSGLSKYDDVVLTIDGKDYDYWDLPWETFNWLSGTTHTVVASTPLTAWNDDIYRFSSWTNGNGLVEASGTFTVPHSDTEVTVNYVRTSVTVTFATSGISNVNDDILTIDGTGYDYWNMPSFKWEKGTTHTVTAETPLTGWDEKIYGFVSWKNGEGLVGASGTFTVADTNTTVTANYEVISVQIQFATSSLPTFSGGVVLTIDGVGYDYWDLPSTYFMWAKGSIHTVSASTPLSGEDHTVYHFSHWTNGDGLSGASGKYTVPESDTTVTANYRQTPSSSLTPERTPKI